MNVIVGPTVTVNSATALKLWSAVGYAVIVTVEPTILGIMSGVGTTNAVLPPAMEWNEGGVQSTGVRSTPDVPQVAFQSTPRFAGSPTTVAAKLIVTPAGTDAGGA